MSHRTSSLFHYTTSLDILKKILKEGLKPKNCIEDLGYEIYVTETSYKNFGLNIPMVCFCDIPISKTAEHAGRYGFYAIGLKKDYTLREDSRFKINPILYVVDDEILKTVHKIYNEIEVYRNKCKPTKSPDDFCNNWPEIAELYEKNKRGSVLTSYVKKYEGTYKGKKNNNYVENEWRYVGGNTLLFTINDISWIIVQKNTEIPKMVNFINRVAKLGGVNANLTKEDRESLCTKIISLDTIMLGATDPDI